MDKKKKLIIAGFIVLVMLMLIGFYISKILPFYIMGSSTPLFIIYNDDVNNSHEVIIEIFDSHNESVFKEIYQLSQNEMIEHPKPPMMKNPRIVEEYTIKVILDNDTTKLRHTKIDPWTTPTIYLYHTSTDYGTSGEIIPLEISVSVV